MSTSCFRSFCISSTTRSPSGFTRHESLTPDASSSSLSNLRSVSFGSLSSPLMILTRHFPQTPFPLHGLSTNMFWARRISRRLPPASYSYPLPDGCTVILGIFHFLFFQFGNCFDLVKFLCIHFQRLQNRLNIGDR